MNYSEQIKSLRLAFGLGRKDFANKIGVSLSTISEWELGKHKPNINAQKSLIRLANIIDNQKKETPTFYQMPGGWAAEGKGWVVHASTKEEALEKFETARKKHIDIETRSDGKLS